MNIEVRLHADAATFLERAEPWLLEREAEHNLLLGIARRAAVTGDPAPNCLFATAEQDGAVVGCVFRTPPHKLGLTSMPTDCVRMLARRTAEAYDELPAILGPEEESLVFAEEWTRIKGGSFGAGMRQGIYELTVVEPPVGVPGALRTAQEADSRLVMEWVGHFSSELGVPIDNRAVAREHLAAGSISLWDDPEPVSMVGVSGRTPHGARIGYVYTPPELRRRGYASAAVAALSQRMLDTGLRFCFLYTDLSNPTSNRIYRRLGYRLVREVVDIDLVGPSRSARQPGTSGEQR